MKKTTEKQTAAKTPKKGKAAVSASEPVETQEEYRQRIISVICGCMAEGQSLRRICRSVDNIPSHSTIISWCNDDATLANQYARAREMMTDYRFEEFRDAAQELVAKYVADGWEPRDAIAMARLETGNMQWEISKLAPKKYGDKLELAGDPLSPLIVNVVKFSDN